MLMRTVRAFAGITLMLAFGAGVLAQGSKTPPAADKGQVYDLEAVLDGTPYTGTMTLKIAGTAVTGSMAIDQPIPVTADIAGTLKENALLLDYDFVAQSEPPCNGHAVVSAKMPADRGSATGTVEASGCSDAPQQGTFSLKKRAAAGGR